MSDFWLDPSSTFIFHVCEQRRSVEIARMRRLTWALAGGLYDKYHNLNSWLNEKKNNKQCLLDRTPPPPHTHTVVVNKEN